MKSIPHFETIICSLAVVVAFAYGASVPLWNDFDDIETTAVLFLGENPFFIVLLAAGILMLSAVFPYILVRAASDQSALARLLIKIFFVSLPAFAGGMVLSLLTGILGLCKIPFHVWYVVSVMSYLIAGIVGIMAMRTRSEYQQILQKKMVKSGEPNSAW